MKRIEKLESKVAKLTAAYNREANTSKRNKLLLKLTAMTDKLEIYQLAM